MRRSFKSIVDSLPVKKLLFGFFLFNMLIRLIIYFSSKLFYFGDYQIYLRGVDSIASAERIPLYMGNFVMSISYIGYFAKYIMGSIHWFFIFNSLLGAAASLLISLLVIKISGRGAAGLITMLLLTIYTEFMVFSSVFYTPVLMIFLLILFLWSLYYYFSKSERRSYLYLVPLSVIFFLTLFFKPELIFLPVFLMILIVLLRKDRQFVVKGVILAITISAVTILVYSGSLFTRSPGQTFSNSFLFFGHTDYGGDGGEGSFVYPENQERYSVNFSNYCNERGIVEPGLRDYNDFQKSEIKSFITHHPIRWVALQAKKLTSTYGVVPEGNSFKVLYTGLLKGKLWLTAVVVVLPVAFIIMLFIQVFSLSTIYSKSPSASLSGFFSSRRSRLKHQNSTTDYFIYIFILLFIYYIIATVFFGHYQERYRIPVIVCFIIPLASLFISEFKLSNYLRRPGIYIRSALSIIILLIWIFQARTALLNRERLENAIELAEKSIINQ